MTMRIKTDHYRFDLPAAEAADILASIADETARQRIADAINTPESH